MVKLVGIIGTLLALAIFVYFQLLGSAPKSQKETIKQAVEQVKKDRDISPGEEQVLKVQVALLDFMVKHKSYPASLDQLVPDYFTGVPIDPQTKEPLKYKLNKADGTYLLGAEVDRPVRVAMNTGGESAPEGEGEASQVAAEDIERLIEEEGQEEEEFIYDPTAKRDPFRPFDLSGRRQVEGPLTPLQKYTLGQLRLTSILKGFDGGYIAQVEDSTGKGFTVREGTLIGNSGGVAVKITKDVVSILETRVDLTGKEHTKTIELKIVRQ